VRSPITFWLKNDENARSMPAMAIAGIGLAL
jgi:hypothetical protein